MNNEGAEMKNSLFGWDKPEPRPIERFTDKSIQRFMVGQEALPITEEELGTTYLTIQGLRDGGRADRAKAGCTYLRFAQGTLRPAELSVAECFHRAANELRAADILDRSAQCYASAAAVAFNAIPSAYPSDKDARAAVDKGIDLALRSAGRAKAQYAAIGVDDSAADAHRLQQEILRKRYSLQGSPLGAILWIWRVVTGYGTSVRRWFAWLVVDIVLFAAIYAALYSWQKLYLANDAPFTAVITPVYLAIVNLVSFGAYTQIVPKAPITEITLVLQAIGSFILIGTGVTFLARK
jgi:hypothetical protein